MVYYLEIVNCSGDSVLVSVDCVVMVKIRFDSSVCRLFWVVSISSWLE